MGSLCGVTRSVRLFAFPRAELQAGSIAYGVVQFITL